MRCSYSCGVDHHPDTLQGQILAFRLLSSQDKELCRNLTVPSVTLLKLVNMKMRLLPGLWDEHHEGAKDENKSFKFAEVSHCWWQSHRAQWQWPEGSLSGLPLPSPMALLPVQQLALEITWSMALLFSPKRGGRLNLWLRPAFGFGTIFS